MVSIGDQFKKICKRNSINKNPKQSQKVDKQKLKNLLKGILGIYVLYFIGSIIQQQIMKIPYSSQTQQPQKFINSNAFVLVPSLCSWIIGTVYRKIFKKQQNLKPCQIPKYNLIICSSLIIVSAWMMTKAIYLTNYPLVTLFKSCNLLSVITVGLLCSRVKDKTQKLQKQKILIGIIVTFGILIYHFGSIKERFEFQGHYAGIGLLVASLVLDGFLPDFQAEIKTICKPTPMQMFEQTNKYKTILSLLYSLLTLQLFYVIDFYMRFPMCFVHMLCLGLTGSLGQIVVFWMITHFKQHVVPFIITTRKIFTVLISIALYGHESNLSQIGGVLIVFAVVFYDFYKQVSYKSEPKAANKLQKIQSKEANQGKLSSDCIQDQNSKIMQQVNKQKEKTQQKTEQTQKQQQTESLQNQQSTLIKS